EKMPLDFFGYYSLIVPFVDGYYRIDEIEKAHKLSQRIAEKYFDRLHYFNSLDANLQYTLGEEIITEIERYRTLVEADLKHGEHVELTPILNQFMESIQPFKYLYGDYEFYTGLIDVAEGYFLDGQIELAQNLSSKISAEYEKRLSLYSQVSKESQRQLISRIQRELSNFNYVVQIVKAYDSTKFGEEIEGKTGPANDPDNDGVSNLLEFALGLNPILKQSGSFLPQVLRDETGLSLTYNSIKSLEDYIVKVQVSTDLSNWTDVSNEDSYEIIFEDELIKTVSVKLEFEKDLNNSSVAFMRLVVESK
ncbi:MAG: hypothetical protein ACPGNW_01700, partial [Verrucomicrobiales bacterium]